MIIFLIMEGWGFSLSDRKLSTCVNALAKVGFIIEQMIEQSDAESYNQRIAVFLKKQRCFL